MRSKIEESKYIHKKALHLSEIGEEYTLIKINDTFELKSDYFGNSRSRRKQKIPPVELGFIKRVKNHVVKNEIYANFVDNLYYPIDIKYVEMKTFETGTIIDELIEIDIDEAYFRTAFLLGVLSPELYKEGSKEAGKISKLGRLISLGSLAKKEEHYHFIGKRLVKKEPKRSKLTENVWYSICKRVADLMHEARQIAGGDFVLYWVDGIYMKNNPKKIEKIVKMFKQFDYDVSVNTGLVAKYTEEKLLLYDKEDYDSNLQEKEKSPRKFTLPKNRRKGRYFLDDQLKKVALEFSQMGAMDDIDSEFK